MKKICPLILCGGSGTRLWPLSRSQYPKQFMELGGRSLFAGTLERLKALANADAPLVVCNHEHRFLAAAAVQAEGARAELILEPTARNTAPAVCVGALAAMETHDDPLLLVLPSDHLLPDAEAFAEAVETAAFCAESGRLVTFGVEPSRPETGYGYIQRGNALEHGFAVARFTEKPSLETARRMLEEGGYFWNSGMFLFRASVYLEELERYAPEMAEACRAAWKDARKDMDFIRLASDPFERCPSESIDYAIMEKTDKAAVVPLSAQWSDLGSWRAVHEARPKDENGNVVFGDVIAEDTRDCCLHSTSRLLATLGVSGLVVAETPDAVLVADMARSQNVRALIARLGNRPEKDAHVHVYRPWGAYETLSRGDRFLVKRITVNPGASLSLQKHHHRAEHWIVVKGTAEVTVGSEAVLLHEDQSTYIPLGTKHRLANPGRIPLEIIEVQTGSYLEEDDIVRYEDTSGRT